MNPHFVQLKTHIWRSPILSVCWALGDGNSFLLNMKEDSTVLRPPCHIPIDIDQNFRWISNFYHDIKWQQHTSFVHVYITFKRGCMRAPVHIVRFLAGKNPTFSVVLCHNCYWASHRINETAHSLSNAINHPWKTRSASPSCFYW